MVVERRCDHELSNADEHDAMTKSAARADQRCRRLMSPLVVAAARPMGSTRTAGAHGQRVVMSDEGGGATMDEPTEPGLDYSIIRPG